MKKIRSFSEWLRFLGDDQVKLRIAHAGHRKLPPQWQMRPRTLPYQIIWLVGSGEAEALIQQKIVRLAAGTFLWLPPYTANEFRQAKGSASTFLSALRFQFWLKKEQLVLDSPMFTVSNAWAVQPYMQQIYEEVNIGLPYSEERIRALFVMIFSAVFRLRAAASMKGGVLNHHQRMMLSRFTESNIARGRLKSSDLARELRLSNVYFARIFRRTWGISPREWLKRERIRLGAQMLSDSILNVSEVAEHLGYQDIFLFSRQFKAVMGCSPIKYRKRN